MQKEGKKNDKKDDKTRWELMPLDCLEDIARVYTEGAKKYGENTWQYLDNGYQRYKGALLRHLYRSENETFDEETGCRHLAQVAWNAIALLWLSKAEEPDLIDKFSSKVHLGIVNSFTNKKLVHHYQIIIYKTHVEVEPMNQMKNLKTYFTNL